MPRSATRRPPMLAAQNGRKVRELLERAENGAHEDLYETIRVGTASGVLRSDRRLGRIRYHEWGPDEFAVYTPDGDLCGFLRGDIEWKTGRRGWRCTEVDNDGGYVQSRGFFDSPAAAMRVLCR